MWAEDLDPRGGRELERRPLQSPGNLKELNLQRKAGLEKNSPASIG